MGVHIVVMGVSGCGKTTVAQAICDQLGFTMAEGDDFHSAANVKKMADGIPLTDEDRWPWLDTINKWMVEQDQQGKSTVVSCSALKKKYRQVLGKGINVLFVHLCGTEDLISGRLTKRKGHYMPPSLLPSQFADLEPLGPDEPGVTVSIEGDAATVENRAINAIRNYLQTDKTA
jgi:gluconokinase